MGWALGDGQGHGDDPAWDVAEAEALYTLLEREEIEIARSTVEALHAGRAGETSVGGMKNG